MALTYRTLAPVLVLSSVLILHLSLSPSLPEGLLALVHHLPPLFLAVFLVYFRKANYDTETFHNFFHHVSPHRKTVVSLGVMAAFVTLVLASEGKDPAIPPNLVFFFVQTVAATVAVGLVDSLRVCRNQRQDWGEVIPRSPHSVARGLATAFYSGFLRDMLSQPHAQLRQSFLANEGLKDYERTWVSRKVIIFFPESDQVRGSVEDFLKREKDDEEEHGVPNLTFDDRHELAGQARTSRLHFLKIRHGGKNNYVIFAENRPLIALHQMVTHGLITAEELQDQFKLYKRDLIKLLDSNPNCRGRYEVVSYRDVDRCVCCLSSDDGGQCDIAAHHPVSVSQILRKMIDEMWEEERGGTSL